MASVCMFTVGADNEQNAPACVHELAPTAIEISIAEFFCFLPPSRPPPPALPRASKSQDAVVKRADEEGEETELMLPASESPLVGLDNDQGEQDASTENA